MINCVHMWITYLIFLDGTVCQGQTLYMSCPGQVINVIDAFFGRLTDDICRPLIPLGAICRYNATNEVRQL